MHKVLRNWPLVGREKQFENFVTDVNPTQKKEKKIFCKEGIFGTGHHPIKN